MGFKKHAPGCKCGCSQTYNCFCPTPPSRIVATPIGGPRPSYYRETPCDQIATPAGSPPQWQSAIFTDNGAGTVYPNFRYLVTCFPQANQTQGGFNLILRSFQNANGTGFNQTHFQVVFRSPVAGNECNPFLMTVHNNVTNSPVSGNTFHLSS